MPVTTVDPPKPSSPSITNPLPGILKTPSGLALLEIQGTIHTPPVASVNGDMRNVPDTTIGNLVFPNYDASKPDDTSWMKLVYLYVGKNQRLTGQVKPLPKAVAVLKRKDPESEALEVAEIVKYKIMFSQRPEPVSDE